MLEGNLGRGWGVCGVQPPGFSPPGKNRGGRRTLSPVCHLEAGRPARPQGHRPWLKVAAIRDVRARVTAAAPRKPLPPKPVRPITLQRAPPPPRAPQPGGNPPQPAQDSGTHPDPLRIREFSGVLGAILQRPDPAPTLRTPRRPEKLRGCSRCDGSRRRQILVCPCRAPRQAQQSQKIGIFTQNKRILLI